MYTESKKYTACERFHRNSPYGKILTMKEPNQNAQIYLKTTLPYTNNLLLTKREGCTGEYWPEVVAVWTERSEVGTKTTEGQYSPVWLELARLVTSLLYATGTMLVLNFLAFENKKYTAYEHFHRNGPYGKTLTMKEPKQNAQIYLKTTLPYNNLGSFIL